MRVTIEHCPRCVSAKQEHRSLVQYRRHDATWGLKPCDDEWHDDPLDLTRLRIQRALADQ